MNYEDIFTQRGGSYHRAMQLWPEARANDFLLPLQWLVPQPGERLLDVPAGGGYLRKYLPDGCEWLGHEPCDAFEGQGQGPAHGLEQSLLPLPFADASAQCAISIAGVHHLSD